MDQTACDWSAAHRPTVSDRMAGERDASIFAS